MSNQIDKARAWDSVTVLKAEITMLKRRVAQAEVDRDALQTSLTEMVGVYWGEGDGLWPPPECIRRAQAILASIQPTKVA